MEPANGPRIKYRPILTKFQWGNALPFERRTSLKEIIPCVWDIKTPLLEVSWNEPHYVGPVDIYGDGPDVSVVGDHINKTFASKGLIEVRPKAGMRIRPRSKWNLFAPDILAWQFEIGLMKKSCKICTIFGRLSNRLRPNVQPYVLPLGDCRT